MTRIFIKKGLVDDVKIANTAFELLKPVQTVDGKSFAHIDASAVLGKGFERCRAQLLDYKLL